LARPPTSVADYQVGTPSTCRIISEFLLDRNQPDEFFGLVLLATTYMVRNMKAGGILLPSNFVY